MKLTYRRISIRLPLGAVNFSSSQIIIMYVYLMFHAMQSATKVVSRRNTIDQTASEIMMHCSWHTSLSCMKRFVKKRIKSNKHPSWLTGRKHQVSIIILLIAITIIHFLSAQHMQNCKLAHADPYKEKSQYILYIKFKNIYILVGTEGTTTLCAIHVLA